MKKDRTIVVATGLLVRTLTDVSLYLKDIGHDRMRHEVLAALATWDKFLEEQGKNASS